MEMPKPAAEHQRLAQLAGVWAGEEKMHPSPFAPAGGVAMGRWQNRMGLGGFHLIADYEQERGGVVSFQGHAVIGYDSAQRYTMHWFDSSGMGHTASTGSWQGHTLVLSLESPLGHSRYVFELAAADRFLFRIDNAADGRTWTTFLEGEYHRG
jgi:hypothetical protein